MRSMTLSSPMSHNKYYRTWRGPVGAFPPAGCRGQVARGYISFSLVLPLCRCACLPSFSSMLQIPFKGEVANRYLGGLNFLAVILGFVNGKVEVVR